MSIGRYNIEWLPQGMVYIVDRKTSQRGMYTQDGLYFSGDLRLSAKKVTNILWHC